jgi:hypothetical protein
MTSQGKLRPTRSSGDIAILVLAAAGDRERSWQQYNELGGVKGGNAAYMLRFKILMATCPNTSPITPMMS